MEFYSSLLLVQETNIHKKKILSEVEIDRRLQDLQHWQIKDNKLSYTHKFCQLFSHTSRNSKSSSRYCYFLQSSYDKFDNS